MVRFDLGGNGRSDLMVTSPWGLGVVGWDGTALASSFMAENGTRIGGWMLDTRINHVELLADVDGDGRAEALMASPWGIGLLSAAGGAGTTRAMAQNGTRVSGWIIDTASNRFLHALDADGDGREEILVTSPWGIGILGLRDGGLTSLMLAPNGTRFGGWLLSTADNWFPVVGDVDGDGRDEIVVTSPWGIGILRFESGTLRSVAMVPNGTDLGGWRLETSVDRVEAAADLDGDGHSELVISGPAGLAVIGVTGGTVGTRALIPQGSQVGEWLIDALHDDYGTVGDVDGDGRAEIVVTGERGLAVLELVDGELGCRLMIENGMRIGGWLLHTADNDISIAIDLDGDGADEVLVTSPWGLGVLRLGGPAGVPMTMAPNGTRLGGWLLSTADNDWLAGHGQSWAVVAHHPDWGAVVPGTIAFLRDRGFAVLETAAAGVVSETVSRLARAVRSADRVFIYLAGHGASGRAIGDYNRDAAMSHIIQFGDGGIVDLWTLAPAFELMADKGARLAVFDGSCTAGETVLAATGERYLGMSSTSIWAPGLTNTPDPSAVMSQFGQPGKFGMWWSAADAASRLTGISPHRFYQKVYRSDHTEIARWSLFYKPAIAFYQAVGGAWDLMTRACSLFEHVYPDVYARPDRYPEVTAYKAARKISVEDYLAWMQRDYDGFAPSIRELRRILSDELLVARAAEVYAAAFPRPWQTIVADLQWDVVAEPVKVLPNMTRLEPRRWSGVTGFHAMVAECLRQIHGLERSWARQAALLRRLADRLEQDALLRRLNDVDLERVPDIGEMLRRSQFEVERRAERMNLLDVLQTNGRPVPPPVLGGGSGGSPGRGVKPRPAGEFTPVRRIPLDDGTRPTLDRKLLTIDRFEFEAFETSVASGIAEVVATWSSDRTAAELILELRAMDTATCVALDLLHYLLTIVEEAVSRAQESAVQTGDLVAF